MADIKKMDIREFREKGFLQEANRLFFHPRGLALEITINDNGTEMLSGIWDYRDELEGIMYADLSNPGAVEKAANVEQERVRHVAARVKLLGSAVQGLD